MENWKTTAAGAAGALPLIISAIQSGDWLAALSGISLALLGFLASDGKL